MVYEVILSKQALSDYSKITKYLLHKFSEKEAKAFDKRLSAKLILLSINPFIYNICYEKKQVRKCVINNLTLVFYQVKNDQVNILSLFDGRQNPEKLKERLE